MGREVSAFSIIVPNWNGKPHLARCLSSLHLSAKRSGRSHELIVVDDASTDESWRVVEERFPRVRLLRNETNRGFAESVNRGVEAASGEIVVLINNDIVVKEDFVAALLEPFSTDSGQLFGVSARTVSWVDKQPNHINMSARFAKGMFELQWSDSPERTKTLFLQGGACAMRRSVFLELGGFNPLYSPGYWEDYDLSYRAARCGYTNLYEPRSLAYHLGKSSMRQKLGRAGIESLMARNQMLFTWLNLTDSNLVIKHFLWLPFHIGREFLTGRGFTLTKAFFQALPRAPRILSHRLRRRDHFQLSDREVLAAFAE
jgi:GT2 family glycosyltransferase